MNNVTIEKDGWFKANVSITLPSDLKEENFREICDDENLSYNMAMFLSEHGKETGEHLPGASMADYIIDEIRNQICNGGNDYGMVGDIEWSLDYDITIDGEEVDFWDLDEVSQKRIIDNVLEGCYQGELLTFDDVEYEITFDSVEDEITGSVEYSINGDNCSVLFTIDDNNVEFDDDLPSSFESFITDEILEAYNEEQSLDDKLAAAEEKASSVNEGKETKSHDDLEL